MMSNPPTYVVADIGCLECGNPSEVLYVGVDLAAAKLAAGEGYLDVASANEDDDPHLYWRGDYVTALFTYEGEQT